ncbi:hypothetical protein BpHYR1_045760 [Brachionus plicatilis]|uniref:Uncharacterized protein n=1 Tax=Brachionus plicatilis TaxID=10195 RepID=A0A3M7RE73_BRAPC|nr:hypothetical protein BpHYR1_045760 [Brachionus plicatilis]
MLNVIPTRMAIFVSKLKKSISASCSSVLFDRTRFTFEFFELRKKKALLTMLNSFLNIKRCMINISNPHKLPSSLLITNASNQIKEILKRLRKLYHEQIIRAIEIKPTLTITYNLNRKFLILSKNE